MSDQRQTWHENQKITYNLKAYNHRVKQEGDYRTIIIYPIIPSTPMLIKHTDYPTLPYIKAKRPWWKRLLAIFHLDNPSDV